MLFKILHGDESRISTDITPFHEGYCYVTHNGNMYVDMNVGTVDAPNYQRKKINEEDLEELKSHLPQMEEDDILATQKWVTENVSSGDAIIDVEALPTSDINDKAIYRLFEDEAFSTFGGVKNTIGTAPVTFYTVDTLPTAGEYVTDNERTYIKAYYQKSDSLAYGYVPGALIGGSDTWIELSQIVSMMLNASLWGGYLTYAEYMEGAFDAAKIFIVYHTKATHYTYKNEWYKIGSSEDTVVEIDDETIILTKSSSTEDFATAYDAFKKNKNIVYYFIGKEYLSIIQIDNSDDGVYDCVALEYSAGDFGSAPETGDSAFYTVLIHHSSGNTTVSYPDVLATREWVRENVGGGDIDDSNYAKLNSDNTFDGNLRVYDSSAMYGDAQYVEVTNSGFYYKDPFINAPQLYSFPFANVTGGGTIATQEWVQQNVSGGGNYAKLDAANTFVGTNLGIEATLVLDASANIPLQYTGGYNSAAFKLINGMGPADSITYGLHGVTAVSSNMSGISYTTTLSFPQISDNIPTPATYSLTLPQENGTLATQEWVTANVGGSGGSVDDSNYAKLDSANTFTGTNTVTINPSDSNPFYFVGGMGGSDTAYGMKFESAMRYSDTTTYGMGGITIDRFQDYGGQIKHTTKITFPESSDSLPATPTTTTLTLPSSSGELATKEYIDAQIDALRTELKAYIDQALLGGEW